MNLRLQDTVFFRQGGCPPQPLATHRNTLLANLGIGNKTKMRKWRQSEYISFPVVFSEKDIVNKRDKKNFLSTGFMLFFIENILWRAMKYTKHPNAKCLSKASVMSGREWALLSDIWFYRIEGLTQENWSSSWSLHQSSEVLGSIAH